jgi:hypothetical protein
MTKTLAQNLRIAYGLLSLDPARQDFAELEADQVEQEFHPFRRVVNPQVNPESWTEPCSEG